MVGVAANKERLVAQRLSIPRLAVLERFMVEIRRRPLPRHGTDHDSKPLPSFLRFCLPARHFSADKKSIEVAVRPRKGSAAVCSGSHKNLLQSPPPLCRIVVRCFE